MLTLLLPGNDHYQYLSNTFEYKPMHVSDCYTYIYTFTYIYITYVYSMYYYVILSTEWYINPFITSDSKL